MPLSTIWSKESNEYRALPRNVSQLVLKQLDGNWRSYFAALQAWRTDPSRFLGRPRLPSYKPKQSGRVLLSYNAQAISRRALREGLIVPSGLAIEIPTQQRQVKQVRIVPRRDHYVVEVVYEREPDPHDLDPQAIAAVDLGIDNLLTVPSNQRGFVPLAVNGRAAKSINQFYNKGRGTIQAQVGSRMTKRLARLTQKRHRRIHHYRHVASRRVIDHLVAGGIGTLVIGYNPGWKQGINLGRITNQTFVALPHARLGHLLSSKAQLAGITVVTQEESYTSKCRFLDGEFP